MRVLVLGATGMLGHKMCQVLREKNEVTGTARHAPPARHAAFEGVKIVKDVDALRFATLADAARKARPDAIINCIGIVKQSEALADLHAVLEINSLLPHRLAALARERSARLVHVSTDCVFSGARGNYREQDVPDAADYYGQSKLAGEVEGPGCLTLRTSVIGRALQGTHGLIDWFISQRGRLVNGYSQARFSGLTTTAFAELVRAILANPEEFHGLYHASGAPITKLELLTRLNEAADLGVRIEAADQPAYDRTLDSSRLQRATGWAPPSWDAMVQALAHDAIEYEHWRWA